jgi:hypothetical protein
VLAVPQTNSSSPLRSSCRSISLLETDDPFDPELVAGRARARELCWHLNATRESQEQLERRQILRDLFGKGGDSVWMQPPFYCDYGAHIGDFSPFGPAVQIFTPLHPLNAEQRRRTEFGKAIDIGSDVGWAAARSSSPASRSVPGPSSALEASSGAMSPKRSSPQAIRVESSARLRNE